MTESAEAYELSNVVETALARALVLAAEAKRWDVVMQIADELGRRGSAHHPSTVADRASTQSVVDVVWGLGRRGKGRANDYRPAA